MGIMIMVLGGSSCKRTVFLFVICTPKRPVAGSQEETLAPVFCGEEVLVELLFPAGTKNRTYRKIPDAITATIKRIIGRRFIGTIVPRKP